MRGPAVGSRARRRLRERRHHQHGAATAMEVTQGCEEELETALWARSFDRSSKAPSAGGARPRCAGRPATNLALAACVL